MGLTNKTYAFQVRTPISREKTSGSAYRGRSSGDAAILSPFQFKRLAEALRRPEGVRQPVDNGDLLELFLTAKEVEGCSPKTIAYYEATLQHMESWLSKPIARVSSDDLRKYLSEYELSVARAK